eukprot:3607062-Pyramimonas_sp.AAC.1
MPDSWRNPIVPEGCVGRSSLRRDAGGTLNRMQSTVRTDRRARIDPPTHYPTPWTPRKIREADPRPIASKHGD